MPVPSGYRPLPGSDRPQIPASALVGRVQRKERVGVTLLLRARPDAPEEPDLEQWQGADPSKRQYLSAEQYIEMYGSTEEDLRAVIAFLESKGLTVIESSAGRRRVVAEGDAAKINAAFGVTLNVYRAPESLGKRPGPRRHPASVESQGPREDINQESIEQVYRGFDGPVHLPSDLIGVVSAVIGLDNRQLAHPVGTGTGDPPGANYLSPDAVAQLYDFPNTGASGQTIGIFEDASSGAAYLHSDIASFIGSLSAAYQTQPASLTDIGVTVGGATYSNNTALVTSSPSGAVGECTIDVAIAAAVAQGGNINVYFTDGTEAGWEAFLDRATFPAAGDSPPSVLTASWGFQLSDDVATIGNPSSGGSPANVLTGKLKAAASRGITVFMAIGDWGSADLDIDGKCHVLYPNGDPWVTACGGTIVGNITPTGFDEFAWSDANTASPFQSFPYVATGGGVSDNFPVPPYQAAAAVAPISKNDGNSRRGLPDVAGMVAMDGFFFAGLGGPGQYGFIGTSLVAPLYAGLIAVINAFLGRNAGFLNPLLYANAPAICHDVRFGNNESGNGPVPPDAPFYVAGPGWDPCTGWGSIDGFRLQAALAPAPILVTAIASGGDFGNVCRNSFADQTLTINNTGFALLLVSNIATSPGFETPSVASYPLAVAPGDSIDVVIRFRPSTFGPAGGTVTVVSNDLLGAHTISVSGVCDPPRLVLSSADTGDFGNSCIGSFVDEQLIMSNSGKCTLTINNITSSSSEFLVPETLSYPIAIAPGGFLPVAIRFAPSGAAGLGAQSATLTVTSDDPAGPATISVSGNVPSGELAVTGSTYFGEVDCGFAEKTLAICNVGKCGLHVSSVAFARKRRHFELVGNPFPATLAPGSCLGVVIRYEASCDPECCELVINSDDPHHPVKALDVVAFTRCRPTCECRPAPCKCEEKPHCGYLLEAQDTTQPPRGVPSSVESVLLEVTLPTPRGAVSA